MVESTLCIRDEDGKLLWKLEEIPEMWRRYIPFLLNTTSADLDRTIIEGLSFNKLIALTLGNPPVVGETKQLMISMNNCKVMGLDELPAELLNLWLSSSSHEVCSHSTASSWLCG